MRKTNILFLIDSFELGGAQIGLINLIKKLDKGRLRAIVACLYDGHLDNSLSDRECLLLKVRKDKIRFKNPRNILTLPTLVKIIRKYNIDIVHATLTISYVWGFYAAKFCMVPIIYRVCGDEINVSLLKRINQYIPFRFTDKFVVVSEASKKQLISLGVKESKIKLIYHGIDIATLRPNLNRGEIKKKFGISKNNMVIGYVGRLSREKGVKDLIKIIREVRNKVSHIKALIVGDGPLRNEMEMEAKVCGLSNNVIFTGYSDNVPNIMSVIDVVIQPMLETVTLGWSTLEAQAMGKVVVGYDVEGSNEVIRNGINGILVPKSDVQAFADAIVSIIEDKHKLEKMGYEARLNIERKFNIYNMIKEYESLYQQIL